MGKRKLSDAQIEELRVLRERGRSYGFIREHFIKQGVEVSHGSIAWQCLRIGADVPRRLQHKQPVSLRSSYSRGGRIVRLYTEEDDAQLRELDAQGMSTNRIAEAMGRKSNSIRGRLYTLARREARAEEE